MTASGSGERGGEGARANNEEVLIHGHIGSKGDLRERWGEGERKKEGKTEREKRERKERVCVRRSKEEI